MAIGSETVDLAPITNNLNSLSLTVIGQVSCLFIDLSLFMISPDLMVTRKNARKERVPQIVDDTQKTSMDQKQHTDYREDLVLAGGRYYVLNASINNYHRWTYVQRFNNFYKDLEI